jgi:pimeloyl-ACP methyl ester carboxylesterase
MCVILGLVLSFFWRMKFYYKILGKFLVLLFIMVGFFVWGTFARAESYMITEDTTWPKGVYIVDGEEGLIITSGATLTIEAGAVVKMTAKSNVIVQGGLIAIGSIDEPIVFTSIKDDLLGNTDNSDVLPAPDDWGAIMINGLTAHVEFDYARIRYGGYRIGIVVVIKAEQVVFNNSDIVDNSVGITVLSPNLQIHNSNIYNPHSKILIDGQIYLGTTLFNYSGTILDLTNNYWGSKFGPTVDPPGVYGTWIPREVDYEPFLLEPMVFIKPISGCIDAMANNYNDEATVDDGSCDYSPNPVILVPGILGSWNFGFGWELDPILHIHDNLWSALEEAGYQEGVDLFAFPYNWRLANTYNALELKNKIDEVKAICDCDQVDIIAHSMGGLVARAYIQLLDYENDIDQLVFLATPQRGAPKAYLMWEGGEVGKKIQDKIQQRIFKLEAELNGYSSVFDYLNNMPMESVKELLPIDDYLKDTDGNLKLYPNGYPVNSFLDILNSELVMSRLDGIEIINMVSDSGAESTLGHIRVENKEFNDGRWSDGYPEGFNDIFGDHGLEYGSGDGTVPEYSNDNFAGADDIIFDSSHNSLITDAQLEVIEELTGTRPADEVRKNIFSKFLMVRIFSPADINVLSPDGQRIGKDFDSNSVVNEIDGGFYTGFSVEPEFIVIPNPTNGSYTVNLRGVDSGEYRVSISYLTDDVEIDQEYTGNIDLNDEIIFTASLSGGNLAELVIEVEENTNDALAFEVFTKHIIYGVTEIIETTEAVETAEATSGIGGAPTNRLVKLADFSAVYYVDEEDIRHLFPTEDVYSSWFKDYSLIETIEPEEFDKLLVGFWVGVNPEVGVIGFDNSNKAYIVLISGELEETEAIDRVIIIPTSFEYGYRQKGKKYLIML